MYPDKIIKMRGSPSLLPLLVIN